MYNQTATVISLLFGLFTRKNRLYSAHALCQRPSEKFIHLAIGAFHEKHFRLVVCDLFSFVFRSCFLAFCCKNRIFTTKCKSDTCCIQNVAPSLSLERACGLLWIPKLFELATVIFCTRKRVTFNQVKTFSSN